MVGTVEKSGKVKACTGKIAEQGGKDIPGQYLPGGGTQAKITFDKALMWSNSTPPASV